MASYDRRVNKPIVSHPQNFVGSPKNVMRRVHTHDGIFKIYEEDDSNNSSQWRDKIRNPTMLNKKNNFEGCFSKLHRHAAIRGMSKNGKFNVSYQHIPNKSMRFFKDLENTLINTRWRYILLCLCIANGIAWVGFALMWMAVATINGDNDHDSQSDTNTTSEAFMKCIEGTSHFTGYLLLSIETITSIGFGAIYPNYCGGSLLTLTLQALTGVALEGVLVTAVYIKMSRPRMRQYQLTVFSKKTVICLRDGKLCLIFRIRDEDGKHWAKTKLKVYLMSKRYTIDGEELPNYIQSIKLQHYGILMWPVDIVHEIDCESPLWNLSARDLLTEEFELMVMLEGDSLSTGHYCQSQTSYHSSEIHWGCRFIPCVEFCEKKQQYRCISKRFNMTFQYDTPLCSARRLAQITHNLKSASERDAMYYDRPLYNRDGDAHAHRAYNLKSDKDTMYYDKVNDRDEDSHAHGAFNLKTNKDAMYYDKVNDRDEDTHAHEAYNLKTDKDAMYYDKVNDRDENTHAHDLKLIDNRQYDGHSQSDYNRQVFGRNEGVSDRHKSDTLLTSGRYVTGDIVGNLTGATKSSTRLGSLNPRSEVDMEMMGLLEGCEVRQNCNEKECIEPIVTLSK